MQESRLASVVETEEEELGVLVQQPKRGEDIPDCGLGNVSLFDVYFGGERAAMTEWRLMGFVNSLHQLMMNMIRA